MTLIFLCIAGFFAAMVDSIAGGGGLISVPAFLIAGFSPYLALGTNKFASTCGSLTSSIKFAKSGKIDYNLMKYLIFFTFIGAVLGVNTVLIISTKYLNTIVLILLLAVGTYSIFSKSAGLEDNFDRLTKKSIFCGMILSICLGFYDGFFGPGTGSFLIFGLIGIYSFDYVRAGANAKLLNFISNITSLFLFAFHSQINYSIGIPVAVFMIVGAHVGTKMALNKGVRFIKPIFITMSLAAACKMFYNLMS